MEARTGVGSLQTLELKPHPDTASTPAARIEVDIERLGEGSLRVRYRVYGDLDRILVPQAGAWKQADELWRHTCFEAFVRNDGAEGYLELNFAPNQWAAYRFSGYRTGMTSANVQPWVMEGVLGPDYIALQVEVDPGRMARPDLSASAWLVGLSAVIEDTDGGISYWALTHPPGKPDFHHPDSFALILPLPEPA